MKLGSYFKNASECPLSVFISVLVLDDVRELKKRGYVPIDTLKEAFDSIFDEYLQGSNAEGYKILVSQLKDVAILRNKARLALHTVDVLKLKHNKKLVEVLRLLGYRYKFNPNNPDQYEKDIEKVERDVKKNTAIIKGMEEKFRDKAKEAVKESDFDSTLGQLGRFQGYRLDKNEISVSEFVNVLKDFKQENKPRNGK